MTVETRSFTLEIKNAHVYLGIGQKYWFLDGI